MDRLDSVLVVICEGSLDLMDHSLSSIKFAQEYDGVSLDVPVVRETVVHGTGQPSFLSAFMIALQSKH
jgi:hypothetical protein